MSDILEETTEKPYEEEEVWTGDEWISGETTNEENNDVPIEETELGDEYPELDYTEYIKSLHEELIRTNESLDTIVQYKHIENVSIWEKELKDYNVLEGIGLVTLAVILGVVFYKLIGGILTCSL